MFSFKELLSNHNLEKCPQYLWQIKVTDEEYHNLKELLQSKAKYKSNFCSNRFITVRIECALYISEYWRREYSEGAHSVKMILDSLGIPCDSKMREEFYESAQKGFEHLHLQLFESDGGGHRYLDSMLYQGGLPMKLVTGSEAGGVWDRFVRGLVNRKIDFEELNLGIVASTNQSIREFCEQIITALESTQFQLMPFACVDESDSWYLYLNELSKQERNRRRQLRPFSLTWEFLIDSVENHIKINYVVKGLQSLPQAFLEAQGLNVLKFYSVQVRKNERVIDTFDYVNNFCRYAVLSKDSYSEDEYIALYLHNQDDPYIKDYLDMNVPHILYRDKDGKYKLGNKIGQQESFLIIPNGWTIPDDSSLEFHEYSWGETKLLGARIAYNHIDDIIVKSNDGAIIFGRNVPLYWTEMQSYPLIQPNIIEPIYDANKCIFSLCYDSEDGVETKKRSVVYRNKWSSEWTSEPSYGDIYVKAIDNSENYVTPLRFINVGDGLAIDLKGADKDFCKIQIRWPYGRVTTSEGENDGNDIWTIKKTDCKEPKVIHFTFIPKGNSRNQFILSIRAPFKEFSIIDIFGQEITDECWIPYTDVDRYQYHLIGQDIKKYTVGNVRRSLRWRDNKLSIVEDGEYIQIPYEGSLLTLLGTRESLRSMLERTSKNMLQAEIPVQFYLSNGKIIRFAIKDSPYRVKQGENGQIEITDNLMPINFNIGLKLLKLDEPNLEPEEIIYDKDQGCVLPESIRSWGKTILIGNTRGRICPTLVDLNRDMNNSLRMQTRDIAISTINESLSHSTIGDELWTHIIEWFTRCQKEDIPASSLLELYCVALKPKSLVHFAFQLFAKCSNDEERENLITQLILLSENLAFQWYWLTPDIPDLLRILVQFIGDIDSENAALQKIYFQWALQKEPSEMLSYLSNYTDNASECFIDLSTKFDKWLRKMCVMSLTASYWNEPDSAIDEITAQIIDGNRSKLHHIIIDSDEYVEQNQDELSKESELFFDEYREANLYGNEQWLNQRINVVVAHLNGKTNLFNLGDEIKRSVIYASKVCSAQFIKLLNNKLIH